MSTIVRAADAAQFLSLLPQLVGCRPARSLVVVPMSGARSLGALRVDLPPSGVADATDAVAATAIGMACRIPPVDGVVVVTYTDAALADSPTPHRELVEAVASRAEACGLTVRDALIVAADGWGSYLDDAPARPLSEVEGEPAPIGDQVSGARLPEPAPARRRAVAQALRSLESALSAVCGIPPKPATRGRAGVGPEPRIDPAALQAACRLDDLPSFFEEVLGSSRAAATTAADARPESVDAAALAPIDAAALAPMDAAALGWCLERPSLRDVAIVQWASDLSGGDEALEAQRRWEDGAEYPTDLASVLWGEGPKPDAGRLERALELVREVAALLPKRRRAGALAVCAWLSWALGRSSHADRYAEHALHLDRTQGLADIVRSFVAAAHLPDWAFTP
ncbi:DUF4192 family protein [Microbacterium sp.]|uniref:DUF4192 family protein n=1 Tax=Microbacterium sp. TaxID=51671 RepID=UPI0039E680C1